jgi:hypothetical protein
MVVMASIVRSLVWTFREKGGYLCWSLWNEQAKGVGVYGTRTRLIRQHGGGQEGATTVDCEHQIARTTKANWDSQLPIRQRLGLSKVAKTFRLMA